MIINGKQVYVQAALDTRTGFLHPTVQEAVKIVPAEDILIITGHENAVRKIITALKRND